MSFANITQVYSICITYFFFYTHLHLLFLQPSHNNGHILSGKYLNFCKWKHSATYCTTSYFKYNKCHYVTDKLWNVRNDVCLSNNTSTYDNVAVIKTINEAIQIIKTQAGLYLLSLFTSTAVPLCHKRNTTSISADVCFTKTSTVSSEWLTSEVTILFEQFHDLTLCGSGKCPPGLTWNNSPQQQYR